MKSRRAVPLLLLFLVTGCATARVVRLDTGQGTPIVLTPRTDDTRPVEVEEDDFQEAVSELSRSVWPDSNPQQAARQLFELEARSGSYLFNSGTRGVTPLEGSRTRSRVRG